MLDTFDSDQPNTMSSYMNYPEAKPFINTEWCKPITESPKNCVISKAFPESNRDLIMGTLKKLQKKLNKLEIDGNSEGSSGRHDLGIHSRSTVSRSKTSSSSVNLDIVDEVFPTEFPNSVNVTKPELNINDTNDSNYLTPEFEKKSDEKTQTAEQRVHELEMQLNKMRKLLNDDTTDKGRQVTSKVARFNQYNDLRSSLTKSSQFESDSTQFDCESPFEREDYPVSRCSKMRQRTKLSKNKNNKYKTSKVKSGCCKNSACKTPSSQRQPSQSNNHRVHEQSIPIRKSINTSRSCSADANLKAHQHYRFNVSDLPFCVGKSTTPSHSLVSNIQNVMSLLKQHHPKLCGSVQQLGHCSSNNCSCNKSNTNTPNRRDRSKSSHLTINGTLNTTSSKRSTSTPNSKVKSRSFIVKPDHVTPEKNLVCSSKNLSNGNWSKANSHQTSSSIRSLLNTDEDDTSFASENFDWNELLRILQEEYTKLVLHHYDLTKKLMKCSDGNKRVEYELKAEYLNKKMKAKAKQINKFKALQQSKQKTCQDTQDENKLIDSVRSDRNHASELKQMQLEQSNRLSTSCNKINKCLLFNSSSTSLFSQDQNSTTNSGGFNTLQLFKDIKNLQMKIQHDLDY